MTDENVVTSTKAEPPRGALRVLRVPDPTALLDRLRAGRTAGLLSRQARRARVGEQQWVVNELRPTGADAAYVWAVVTHGESVRYSSVADLPDGLRAGLDRYTREEFAAVQPIHYLPLDLVTEFEEPIELKQSPPGRRFGPLLEIAEARKNSSEIEKALWGSPAGKKYMAKMLTQLLPEHKTYVEPFAGSAAVFFQKEPVEQEILNDKDPDVAFSFRFVRDCTDEQLGQLKQKNWLVSPRVRDRVKAMKPSGPVDRFYKIRYMAYASFYNDPERTINPERTGETCRIVQRIPNVKKRLAGVKIYDDDYVTICRKYDSASTAYYFDPPYVGYSQGVGEKEFDGEKFAQLLRSLKGKCLATWGGKWKPEEMKKLFHGLYIKGVVTLSGTPRGGVAKRTWLVANYELPRVRKIDSDDCELLDFGDAVKLWEKAELTTEALETEGGMLVPGQPGLPADGLILSPPEQAELVLSGKKKLVVKSKKFDLASKTLLLISERKALGVIDLGDVEELSLNDFEAREKEHRIPEELRLEWAKRWVGWKRGPFWAWPIVNVVPFARPRKTNIGPGPQVLAHNVVVKDADGAIDLDKAAADDLAKAQTLARIFADGVSDFVKRTLRFISGPSETVKLIESLPAFATKLCGTLSRIEIGKANEEEPKSAIAAALELLKMMPRVQRALDDAPKQLRDELSKATSVLERLRDLTRDFPGAEDISEVGKVSDYELAPIHGSGERLGSEITLDQVLEHCKSFKLRMPFVYLVGGVCNRGSTENDIDLLIKGPLSDELRHVVQFRLGRMFPPELSKRIQFLDDTHGGPFTRHVEIADLVVEVRPNLALKEMSLSKQDDPLLDLPKTGLGPRPAVLQYHIRGMSNHADLRMKIDDHLVGWTLSIQKTSAIPSGVDSVEEAKRIAASFSIDGDRYSKPLRAPARVLASPKARQPLVWLELDAEVFPPGEIGATRNKPGVIVAVDRPQVEFGTQSPFYHEYFFSKGKVLNGILNFRQLVGGDEADEEELEAGRVTPRGQAFWTAQMAKDLLPSVLERRAVRVKRMPPDGYSAIPLSLERVIPKEFQYWKAKGREARDIRDALVESRFLTAENVQLVDGEFRRVVKKMWMYKAPEDDTAPEPYRARFRNYMAKQAPRRKFALSWQYWKRQTVVRAAPSRQVWHLMIDAPAGGLDSWQLQRDPLSEDEITAVYHERSQKDLMTFGGDVDPGAKIGGDVLNETKATPSAIRIQDSGEVEVLDDQPTFKKLRFQGKKLRGIYTLVAEEEGSRIWLLSRGAEPSREAPEKYSRLDTYEERRSEGAYEFKSDAELFELGDTSKSFESTSITLQDATKYAGVQVWDPAEIKDDDDKAGDRAELRPLALFQPMKPPPRESTQFTDPDELVSQVADSSMLKGGVFVEPKFNGSRIVIEKDDRGRILLFSEEVFERKTPLPNLAKTLPLVAAELEKMPGPFILDAELQAVDERGEMLPRRLLAPFRGTKPVDDSGVRFFVFDALYLPREKNLTQAPQADRRDALEGWFGSRKLKHLQLSPIRLSKTAARLRKDLDWARKQPGSEGAMVKGAEATYSLGGENDLWLKWKAVRTLNAIVHDRDPVKGAQDVWNYSCAIGPIAGAELDDWEEVIEIGGKHYTSIGVTGNSKLDLEPGDIVIVDVLEILYSEGPPHSLRWFGPATIVEEAPAKAKPANIDDVTAMLQPGERKNDFLFKRARSAGKLSWILDHLKPVDPVSESFIRDLKRALDSSDEQQVALGVVLEPEIVDAQNDVYSTAEVQSAATHFMSQRQNVKLMHRGEFVNDRVAILGSFIAADNFKVDGEQVIKGTWLMFLRAADTKTWRAMLDDRFTGLSIGGSAVRKPN